MADTTSSDSRANEADSPSLVHTLETSGNTDLPNNYQKWLLRGREAEWQSTVDMYREFDKIDNKERAWTLQGCRCRAWFMLNRETDKLRVAANSCHLRWCPLCSRARQYCITESVTDWLQKSSRPKFVTFTLKHSDAELEFQIKVLYDSFRRLRRVPEVKKAFRGGVWFFQITLSKSTNQWHPHLHLLVDGDYFPQRRLSRIWKKITLTSEIVDIRGVDDIDKAAEYVARYAAKPAVLSKLESSRAFELVKALHGRRLCGSFGSAKNISLRPKPIENAEIWRKIGGWAFIKQLSESNKEAKAVIKAWLTGANYVPKIDLMQLQTSLEDDPDARTAKLTIDDVRLINEIPP